MIIELVVRDLGVFAHARLELGPGLNVLTGETGAGKSLVVGALQLLLGGRADASVVRPGASEAVIDGRFETADGDEVILTRTVPADGRSRAYIDGRPVTVAALAEQGQALVELHGQHEHQRLLQTATQRDALDRFAGVDRRPLQAARAEVSTIDEQLGALGGDARTRAREVDLLRFQLEELDGAGLVAADEDDRLDREEDELADSVRNRAEAESAAGTLIGDDGLVHQLQSVIGALAGRAPFRTIESQLRAAAAELADAGHELRGAAESMVDDPERLAAIRERRALLADLRRKYGDTLEAVLVEREAIRARLDELIGHDEQVRALTARRERAAAAVAEAAAAVAAQRRQAAPRLAEGIQSRLRLLAMPAAEVQIRVDGDDPADDVQILLAANPGAPAAPIARAASGGELSRTTLALRLELTAGPPTLVFDEVDAGIGGEAAWAVGGALGDVASRHQVLVVTHLPQVAAFATRHLHVAKDHDDASTTATTSLLEPDDRVGELARMLSGRPDSATGQEHARELLTAAGGDR